MTRHPAAGGGYSDACLAGLQSAVLVRRFSDPHYAISLDPFNDRASISEAVEQEAPDEPRAPSNSRLANTQPPQAFVAGTN